MSDLSLPRGFQFAGLHCGIKKTSGKKDLALLVSDEPSVAAGVYTQNLVRSASVEWNQSITPTAAARAVVVNSGNANACTGPRGVEDNLAMARHVAAGLGCEAAQCLVMSTGIIGEYLPMPVVRQGIDAALEQRAANPDAFRAMAEAILTTDAGMKIATRSVRLSDGDVRLAGFAKGAGMIGPNLATLLGVVITDAAIKPSVAQGLLTMTADHSFNCISVEGHTSTSDCLVLMASGASGITLEEGEDRRLWRDAMKELAIDLARQIPADGEGATHLIEIRVSGCQTDADARQIARTVANSALVKTAIYGADPNWGRIVSAAGYAGIAFDPKRLSLTLNGVLIFNGGMPTQFDAARLSRSIKEQHETRIELQFQMGQAGVTFWTSDLTVEYVQFNADYHT